MISFPFVASSSWLRIGSPLANHLWQCTLFVLIAALLTLTLHKNHARTRYWLWLLASAKFLFPFSLLVSIGTYFGRARSDANADSGLLLMMQSISGPFTFARSGHHATSPATSATHVLPALFLIAWFVGFLAVVLSWCFRVRRLHAAARAAKPLECGPEFEVLRRLERTAGITRPVPIMGSNAAIEPGILGIFRPVLLLPAGISERLGKSELEAILTHELCHVRYRDNLAAALHMLVEALFWFHPFVWWIGAKLVDERERACDEEVLAHGSDPQIYAESILKICKFYLESPIISAAGVTSSNLKKRIEAIMLNRTSVNLESSKKFLFVAMAGLALAGPVILGFTTAVPRPAQAQSAALVAPTLHLNPTTSSPSDMKEMLSKKEDGNLAFTAKNVSLLELIAANYDLDKSQIIGAPDWIASERYDLTAKLPATSSNSQIKPAFQKLLAERFNLKVHNATTDLPTYALVVADSGPKLSQAKPGNTYADGIKGFDGLPLGPHMWRSARPGEMTVQALPMITVAKWLSTQVDRPVLDNTNLKGDYDFTLQWTPDSSASGASSLSSALEQQLGLKLVPRERPLEVIVIDHVEKPSAK
jgi:bla regulator protein blaR1